eukprot:comp6386_c0_seq1/m.2186 comp6386_c0_seq1/g.2186  ORF comp6386_c0_seq1/g.2186 comp6386_c0_seq1/m.2186 type:complete len:383 (-) comp6386_c0_seq1:138-1286(-)
MAHRNAATGFNEEKNLDFNFILGVTCATCAAIVGTAMCLGGAFLVKYHVAGPKLGTLVFFLLSLLGFCLTNIQYIAVTSGPLREAMGPGMPWMDRFSVWIFRTLRWMPVMILYMRLAISVFGRPSLSSTNLGQWQTPAALKGKAMGLSWLLRTLLICYIPYIVGFILDTLGAVEEEGLDSLKLAMDVVFLLLSMVVALTLFKMRKVLQRYQLDQSHVLIIFFTMFIIFYAYATIIQRMDLRQPWVIVSIVTLHAILTLLVCGLWGRHFYSIVIAARNNSTSSLTARNQSRRDSGPIVVYMHNDRRMSAPTIISLRKGSDASNVVTCVDPSDMPVRTHVDKKFETLEVEPAGGMESGRGVEGKDGGVVKPLAVVGEEMTDAHV